MYASLRRTAIPATILLCLSLFCLAALPASAQSYTPNPDGISASVSLNSAESATDWSSPIGGLPSVSAGGTATVTFQFQASYSAYHGGGATNVYYLSDDETTWTPIASLTSSTDVSESVQVSVSNLSTLEFKLEAYAEAAQGGSASISGIASNFVVAVGSGGPSLPTPPQGATTFQNLQWAGLSQNPTPPPSGTGWTTVTNNTGSNCIDTSQGSGDAAAGQVIPGPSFSAEQ